MTTANDIIETLASMQDEEQRRQLCRFFKTGKGEYGEGDRFLGLRVPQTRSVVRAARHDVPLNEVEKRVTCKSVWIDILNLSSFRF